MLLESYVILKLYLVYEYIIYGYLMRLKVKTVCPRSGV